MYGVACTTTGFTRHNTSPDHHNFVILLYCFLALRRVGCGIRRAKLTRAASSTTSYQHEADYVIVGAGSAGCVLANRITENASSSVSLCSPLILTVTRIM